MRYSTSAGRTIPLLVFLPLLSMGQRAPENIVPLKNWAAPLYWQPSQAETQASGRAQPQLQFSANQVSANALTFIAITPCRLVDTRGAGGSFNGISPFSGPSIAAAATVTFPVQSATEASTDTTPAPCGVIPSFAQAYSFNVTVVPHAGGAVDYISLWPAGGTQPFVATLNDPQGAIAGNAAIVPAGTPSGGVSIFNAGPATMDVIIDMNGFFAAPSDLNGNTAIGFSALTSNTTGTNNTAVGGFALASNTTGIHDTAVGAGALAANTTGGANTAVGNEALGSNTTGGGNTAVGGLSLSASTTGGNNTAIGQWSLLANTTGSSNTASGQNALGANTTGGGNTANGQNALAANSTGGQNTALGFQAMMSNNAGGSVAVGANAMQLSINSCCDAAFGTNAMQNNTFGQQDTAVGGLALMNNTTGNNNIAVGYNAATNVTGANSNNIHIGSAGASGDSAVIKIGTPGTQASFFAAGVSGVTTGLSGAVNVVIDTNGQFGTVSSSARFKEDIEDMGDASSGLLRLRPVTFRYKQPYLDGSKPMDYGLIAEEVARVYPDLVVKNADGQVETVQYQKLTPMLLNELQKQAERHAEESRQQAEQNRQQAERIRSLEERLAALEALQQAAPEPAR